MMGQGGERGRAGELGAAEGKPITRGFILPVQWEFWIQVTSGPPGFLWQRKNLGNTGCLGKELGSP